MILTSSAATAPGKRTFAAGSAQLTALAGQSAVALLVFLARAARARIVAADFLAATPRRLGRLIIRRGGGERFVVISVVILDVVRLRRLCFDGLLDRGFSAHLHFGQHAGDFALDHVQQRAE